MPIRSLLSETSFNSDQTEMIAKAFDDAWAELQGGQAEPAMSSLVRTALAKRIIETAQRDGMTVSFAMTPLRLLSPARSRFFPRPASTGHVPNPLQPPVLQPAPVGS